ncbi:hypothetical protein L218DRAFT_81558 [Marasmius fiardii PR-910]|nr:hypothetical protein L218DRAFT_81558 [Marasmius fiardii PR-910]
MPSSSPFSLFDELTRPKSANRPEATDLILNLLRAVGYEACQTKRNTHYVYSVVLGLRDAYDDVNDWIHQIDSETASDVWSLFSQYTGAINPLEEWLSELLQSLQESCDKERAYARDQDLGENCFNHVRSCETIRDALRKTVEKLDQRFGKDTESTRARYLFGDDYLYLQNVRNKFGNIQGMGGRHGNDLFQKLNDAITYFGAWSADPSKAAVADRVATKGIQIWMLVHAVVEKGTATAAPNDLKAFLDTDELWKELVKAAELVNSHFSNPELAFKDLEKGYEDLIDCLGKRGLSSLPKSLPDYLEVVKLVAKTARPYFAQAVVLAKECQQLANVHSKRKLQERHRIEK